MIENKPLIKAVPEKVGISSEHILKFINHLEDREICLHSFMIIRHGQIAAEGYYPPFTPHRLHRMYSTSKTFVSMAIGLLIDEGRISLDDKIIKFFPEKLPDNVHPYIADMTVRHLLMMATPFNGNNYAIHDPDWVWSFFNVKPDHPSGTVFSYNTAATVTLNAIVEKLSGKLLLDYLRPGLLDPIGFSKNARCIQRPEGGSWGGSGILCSTHDLAKFALLLLNKGKYDGKQLISQEYISAAESKQIDNRVFSSTSDEQFGYGYQIWRTRNNGFACLGMGCQIAVCLPDKDFILVTTADTQAIAQGTGMVFESLWNDIYPFLSDHELPENIYGCNKLNLKLENLKFLPVKGELLSPISEKFNNVNYKMYQNVMNINNIKFSFANDEGNMQYTNKTGDHCIKFGFGKFILGEFPEIHYYGNQIGIPSGKGYACNVSGAWADERTLIIYVYIIDDYFGTLKINVTFDGDKIALYMNKVAEGFLDEYQGYAGGYVSL